MDYLAKQVGFSVKLSVADHNEHVNVLSAKAPWDIALTAAPGTRFEIKNGGSVAIILLADMANSKRNALLAQAENPAKLKKLISDYKRDGFSLNAASDDPAQRPQIDALSVPVFAEDKSVCGVLTLLSMPGELAKNDLAELLDAMRKTARFCGELMP